MKNIFVNNAIIYYVCTKQKLLINIVYNVLIILLIFKLLPILFIQSYYVIYFNFNFIDYNI